DDADVRLLDGGRDVGDLLFEFLQDAAHGTSLLIFRFRYSQGAENAVRSESLGEAVEPALYGAVENVIADTDPESAEEFRIDPVFEGEVAAIFLCEAGDDALPGRIVERGSAFDHHVPTFEFEAHETLQRG